MFELIYCNWTVTNLLGTSDGSSQENRDKALDAEEIAQFFREESSCSIHPVRIKVNRNGPSLSDLRFIHVYSLLLSIIRL